MCGTTIWSIIQQGTTTVEDEKDSVEGDVVVVVVVVVIVHMTKQTDDYLGDLASNENQF